MNSDVSTTSQPLPEKRAKRWRLARRAFVGLASVITLVALFYAEEDWRGKRAWEERKRELQAAGDFAEWKSLEPPPVSDELNFYKAPGIDPVDWTGRGGHALYNRITHATGSAWSTNPVLVATISVEKSSRGAASLAFDDPGARAEIAKAIDGVLGRSASSAQFFTLLEHPLESLRPAAIALSASRDLTADDLTNLLPSRLGAEQNNPRNWLQIRAADGGSFWVELTPGADGAADYLAHTKPLESDFEAARKAMERPYARMDGDYRQPVSVPIPNFVLARTFAQTLANQTKCHLLRDDPDAALQDLTLLRGVCHVLDGKPTGQPMTLMQAMINIAVAGLYADTIADGMRLGGWTEPQFSALQQQLSQIDLIPVLAESFHEERISSRATLESASAWDLFKALAELQGRPATWREEMKDPLCRFLAVAPRGWAYQNIVVASKLQRLDKIGDGRAQLVFPDKLKSVAEEYDALPKSSPYSYLVAWFHPNGTRAWVATAWAQTKINEGQIACALERFRLAHGQYPETLAALAPDFIDHLPHDVIGGQELHYRRQDAGFLLYSIGWDQKDDGGKPSDAYAGSGLQENDWVWPSGAP